MGKLSALLFGLLLWSLQLVSSAHPKTKCEQERDRAMGEHLIAVFIPQCDVDGNYKPLQCSGVTGHCWCVNSRGQEIQDTNTPPGHRPPNCDPRDPPAHPMTKCEQERENALGEHLKGVFIPQCDADGNYKPRQCSSSTGHCWCVNSRGQRIPGTDTPPGQRPTNCQSRDPSAHPKTKCEQERDRAMGEHLIGVFIPQCDVDGNYKPLQCSGVTGHCWCVNSRGQEIPGTNTPPGHQPPNCESRDPPAHPKTKCELEREKVLAEHLIGAVIPQCDAKGNFKPLQCSSSTGHCWCVNSMGERIPGTNTPLGRPPPNCDPRDPPAHPKTKCEQERDSAMGQHLFAVFIPQCDVAGNYKPQQCSGVTGHCWCVNSRGQRIPGTNTPPGHHPPNCGSGDPPAHPKTKCELEREKVLAEHSIEAVIPQCDANGNYKPLQCNGFTGHCWCVNSRGERIPGTNTLPDHPPPNCDPRDPPVHHKTKCQQERDSAMGQHLIAVFIPQCDADGNYKPLQCSGATGHCWCVNSRGQEIPGTNTPPGHHPPNCDPRDPPVHHKTKCQQERDSAMGQHLIAVFIPQCDADGNYKPLQCSGATGHCWCVNSRGQEIPGTNTPPGHHPPNCDPRDPPVHHKTKCQQERDSAMGQHLIAVFIPQCDADGNYKPLQCSGATGHCWCVNSRGQEIPGTNTPPGHHPPNCDPRDPPVHHKTKCQQERDSAMGQHLIAVFIPQCDADGNYKPLQCSGATGHCWCVNSRGQEIPGTNTPPGHHPPNCDPRAHHKTKCEQERDSAMGEHLIAVFIPQCDADGNYKPLQCSGVTGHCWCVDNRGQEIPGTNTPPGHRPPNCDPHGRPKTKCEQERDNAMAEQRKGVFIPQCDVQGHYMPRQCSGVTGHCWCVNIMGQQIAGTNTPPGFPRANCRAPARPKTKCELERDSTRAKRRRGAFIPQCDADGNYKPLQCRGSTGYCWCVDSRGQQIAGTNSHPGHPHANCGAPVRPKTKCEQERDNAMAKHMRGVFIPQCDVEGNYTPQQCSATTGHCWCVNSMGQEIAGTNSPPGHPPAHCGVPARPKTKCEQERHRAMVKHLTGIFIPQCDVDGNYRSLQCSIYTGHCWCVNSMGQEIPGTNTPPGHPPPNCRARPRTRCELERDSAMAKHLIGIFIPQCDVNGHYKPLQCWGSTGYCWCVNSRGQQIAGSNTPPGHPPPHC
ncbi:thyroglobulin-like isoform X2 [Brachyhypopomus gauderio]|uniref:thyroglobulin-like isoform X2 n=1 Tax=Brachyhypopomus gauderio TaxID=698409 RepID=UPI0040410D82